MLCLYLKTDSSLSATPIIYSRSAEHIWRSYTQRESFITFSSAQSVYKTWDLKLKLITFNYFDKIWTESLKERDTLTLLHFFMVWFFVSVLNVLFVMRDRVSMRLPVKHYDVSIGALWQCRSVCCFRLKYVNN